MTNRFSLVVACALAVQACGDEGAGGSSGPMGEGDGGRRDSGRDARTNDAKNDPPDNPSCKGGDDEDRDKDGFTPAQGDCDDCTAAVNPGAFDFVGDSLDDDCSGSAAKASDAPCDRGLAIDSSDAQDAARAIGLCTFSDEDSRAWGVISARFTDASGVGALDSPLAAGLLPNFGVAQPSDGESLLALSSGVARAPDQKGYTGQCDIFGAACLGIFGCTGGDKPPAGYPKESSVCKSSGGIFDFGSTVYNPAALELTIRVPNNAKSLSFDSIFYTLEYPKYVCSSYNDFYVVFKEPTPAGVSDGNIVFDSNGDPIGVNTGLLSVCDPDIQDPESQKQFDCAQGTALLKNTGYGRGETSCELAGNLGGAATGWLHTTAPVQGGEIIKLRFTVWDTNDADLDSTVLIDNFKWSQDDTDIGTVPII